MGRVEDLSTGRLVELLTQCFLDHDPMPEIARVPPPAVLAELARRALERKEDASKPGP